MAGLVAMLLVVVGLLVFLLWASQLVDLMNRSDEELPGRHDKILWFVLMLACPLLGALVYLLWKRRSLDEKAEAEVRDVLGHIAKNTEGEPGDPSA